MANFWKDLAGGFSQNQKDEKLSDRSVIGKVTIDNFDDINFDEKSSEPNLYSRKSVNSNTGKNNSSNKSGYTNSTSMSQSPKGPYETKTSTQMKNTQNKNNQNKTMQNKKRQGDFPAVKN